MKLVYLTGLNDLNAKVGMVYLTSLEDLNAKDTRGWSIWLVWTGVDDLIAKDTRS